MIWKDWDSVASSCFLIFLDREIEHIFRLELFTISNIEIYVISIWIKHGLGPNYKSPASCSPSISKFGGISYARNWGTQAWPKPQMMGQDRQHGMSSNFGPIWVAFSKRHQIASGDGEGYGSMSILNLEAFWRVSDSQEYQEWHLSVLAQS